MSKLFWRAIKALPVIVAGSLVAVNPTWAQSLSASETQVDATLQQINRYQSGNGSVSQVTNVNQLRDVSPSDWAYEALRSLVDRYGCIVGYPNQTYRGNRALSRYEFAAGLNSCLNQIERLIASSEAILREDIDTLNRLMQEFEAELATLGGRVDNLESRTAFLEDHQFSTTTKLKGEVIFSLADTFGDVDDEDPTETTFSDRVRLNFDTSFYGNDRLRTRLQAGNVADFSDFTGADSTRLGYDVDTDNEVEISDLHYRFPIGEKFRGYVGTVGLDIDDIFAVANPILESSGTGALSRFTRRDPITLRGAEGAGIGATYEINDMFTVSALYLAEVDDASDPDADGDDNGIFNGSFSTGAQLVVEPIETLELALSYIYEYQEEDDVNLTGSTSSELAKRPFELRFGDIDTRAHQVGLSAS
ncbi:MAG: iron uptake porin, partial [Xenococcaceae cyanobacterium MO_167.B52]|nr:iron uptake porin [Xenococcaceae cyanobacterium MO_167.B52]